MILEARSARCRCLSTSPPVPFRPVSLSETFQFAFLIFPQPLIPLHPAASPSAYCFARIDTHTQNWKWINEVIQWELMSHTHTHAHTHTHPAEVTRYWGHGESTLKSRQERVMEHTDKTLLKSRQGFRIYPDKEGSYPRYSISSPFPALRYSISSPFPVLRYSISSPFPALRYSISGPFPALRYSISSPFPALRYSISV